MPDVPIDGPMLLYGVCGAPDRARQALRRVLRNRPGIDAPLAVLACGELSVLASEIDDPAQLRRPETSTVLRYQEVVEASYRACTMVPLRFGTWTDSAAAARALVSDRAAALRAQLERFDGRVEIGVRVRLRAPVGSGSASEAAATGRAYLEARRQERRQASTTLRALQLRYREAVGAACVDATRDRGEDAARTVSLAFLVPRDEAPSATDRLAGVDPASVDAQTVVGPWAPFSFAALT
jgi:hypothetical protein